MSSVFSNLEKIINHIYSKEELSRREEHTVLSHAKWKPLAEKMVVRLKKNYLLKVLLIERFVCSRATEIK